VPSRHGRGSLTQMDYATQSSAASAEDSANLAQTLNTEAHGMNTTIAELVCLVHGAPRNSTPEPKATGQRQSVSESSRHKVRGSELLPLNCWEFKKCGREAGGAKAADSGVCPAYPHHGPAMRGIGRNPLRRKGPGFFCHEDRQLYEM
jgi:hypothetical protein